MHTCCALAATSTGTTLAMQTTFTFPDGLDRDQVIFSHRMHDTCMHCCAVPSPDERLELDYDCDQEIRRSNLLDAIELRMGTDDLQGPARFSTGFIAEQAASRYFMLLDGAQADLKSRFSEADFAVILNAECSPVWLWDTGNPVAAMVAGDNGIGSLDELAVGSHMRTLLEKLMALSPLENAALVDACERVWRGYDNPLL